MYSSKQHCCVKMRKALEECTAVKSWIVILPAYSYYGEEASDNNPCNREIEKQKMESVTLDKTRISNGREYPAPTKKLTPRQWQRLEG